MMLTILLFFCTVAVAAVLFTGWAVFHIVRLIGRTLGWVMGSPARVEAANLLPGQVQRPCGNVGCRAPNPLQARFCRRCGRSLLGQPVVTMATPMAPLMAAPTATAPAISPPVMRRAERGSLESV